MIALLPSLLLLLAGSAGVPSLAPGERWTYAITDGGASEPAVLEIVIRGGSERWTGVVSRAAQPVRRTFPKPSTPLRSADGASARALGADGHCAAGDVARRALERLERLEARK